MKILLPILEKALLKYPKAKRIAVENFTSGLSKMDMASSMNLAADAQSYKWNPHTVAAIKWILK